MIKLEHEVLYSNEQMEFIIEGMRNPMNSWEKSDSTWGCYCYDGEMKDCDICNHIAPDDCTWNPDYILGKNDLNLMTRLSKAGKDHRKYMRMIPVMIRITAPLYWWKEFDTYKIATVANSTSTMHKIAAKEFTISDFSTEHLMSDVVNRVGYCTESIYYKGNDVTMSSIRLLDHVIMHLNIFRKLYLETRDKAYWWQMIQLLPSSYNQTRNLTMNYEVLSNIYASRCNHKLDEWVEFCKWIESLPHSYLITGKEPSNDQSAEETDNNPVNKATECVDDRSYNTTKEIAPNDKIQESAIVNMTRAEINRNYRLMSSNLFTNKDLEDWKTGEKVVSISSDKDTFSDISEKVNYDKLKEDSDNDKPQRNCNC